MNEPTFFHCPHCGSSYIVKYVTLPIADSGSVYCDVCRRRMSEWNSTAQPFYRVFERARLGVRP
jgi:predicted Zn finger-like uncharacterized protein